MQVELKYPPASERPTQTVGQAQPLSFRPGDVPKQAAKLPQWAPAQACAPLPHTRVLQVQFPMKLDASCAPQDSCVAR